MSTAPSLDELIKAFAALESAQRIEVATTFNKDVKKTGRNPDPDWALSLASIARHVLYLAKSLGLSRRQGGKAAADNEVPAPESKYSEVVARYSEFLNRRKPPADVMPSPNADDIENLCALAVWSEGSRKQRFYFGLALFLADQEEEGAFEHSFFKASIPTGEAKLPEMIRLDLAWRLNCHAEERRITLPFPDVFRPRKAREYAEVPTSFAYHKEDLERFQTYHDRYRTPTKAYLHLIVYRARKRRPTELIKSFLAISPPRNDRYSRQENIHHFVHVYKAPDVQRTTRASMGRVIPLTAGLCLVGGQNAETEEHRAEHGDERRRAPFRGLEILYFPWTALIERKLLYGLTLSANKTGKVLVSRICARPTPIEDSKGLLLGGVAAAGLENSLHGDRDQEEEAVVALGIENFGQRFDLYGDFGSPAGMADKIMEYCNNNPAPWDVLPGFTRQDGRKKTELNQSAVQRTLETSFGEQDNDRFRSAAGDPFEFWSGIRFGPIAAIE